ncbi:MAG: ATP-binding protein [Ancalomicrobiaceae bacterium]|nr:ATP-binding protein [Ancalomicrobiaceae bacterium]
MNDPFSPLSARVSPSPKKSGTTWVNVSPIPDDALPPPEAHPSLGKPSGRWCYGNSQGALLGFACRFDKSDGSKEFRLLTLWRPVSGGRLAWRWAAWPVLRPLYGLDRLAERPRALVVVTEGEKAADAAARLLPEHVTVTSPNGSKSAAKADWSPLERRRVIVWPDADAPGRAYAVDVAEQAQKAGASSIAICEPPTSVVEGWDAADAENDGWTCARAEAFITAAHSTAAKLNASKHASATATGTKKPSGGGSNDDGNDGGRHRRPAQRDQLMGLTTAVDLWHDEAGECFATYPVGSHRESWPLASRAFARWLSVRSYQETGHAPGRQALEDTIRVLEARAYSEGPERVPRLRVGDAEGKAFVDLCNAAWQAVEIDSGGWRLVDRPAAAFVRSGQMRPLPEPEGGYGIEELRRFVNVERDEDFIMLVMWIIAALRAIGPYPVLVFSGEQGTGKSTISRLVRSLVDPNAAPIRAMPKDDRDLVIGAVNSHVIALDNLSSVPNWLSDALCRLSTGGGFASRMLHTDRDESVMQAMRPIILNGIPSLTDRPDLAARALTIRLRQIPESERCTEAEFWGDWATTAPRVLGALFDALSWGIGHPPSVRLPRLPRMADFARFAVACEPGLGFEPGAFLAAYEANLSDVAETTFEADPVAIAIRDMIRTDHPSGWNGTPTDLLGALNSRTSDGTRRLTLWPQTANSLGSRVDRIAPLLRQQGFRVDRKHSGSRTISIAPPAGG